MKLTETQRKQITEDLAAFTNEYAGKTREERKSKGQFFTPAPYILYVKNDIHYNNFSNWWYSARKRREGGLVNFMFDILFLLYGGSPSLLKYVEVIPNLDWSHPWTDEEILKEIGLPDFDV